MKPSEILDKAADIIVRDGWWQGAYYKEPSTDLPAGEIWRWADDEARRTAPCCQAGAISRAAFGVAWADTLAQVDHVQGGAYSRADGYMRRYAHKTFGDTSPIAWNDEPERTAEEVVEALRGAAELAREAGE